MDMVKSLSFIRSLESADLAHTWEIMFREKHACTALSWYSFPKDASPSSPHDKNQPQNSKCPCSSEKNRRQPEYLLHPSLGSLPPAQEEKTKFFCWCFTVIFIIPRKVPSLREIPFIQQEPPSSSCCSLVRLVSKGQDEGFGCYIPVPIELLLRKAKGGQWRPAFAFPPPTSLQDQ